MNSATSSTTTIASTTTTTTQATTTTLPLTSLSPPDEQSAKTTLQNLYATADALKQDIQAFTGDPILVADILSKDLAMMTKIDQLIQNLPYTPKAEVESAITTVVALREDFDRFILEYLGNKSKTQARF